MRKVTPRAKLSPCHGPVVTRKQLPESLLLKIPVCLRDSKKVSVSVH